MTDSDNIRNLGIIAHIDAGKTTTTEHILFVTGKNKFVGSVDEGTTSTDYMSQERERGITIVSAAVSCVWNDTKLYIIDTPGHVDFTSEVERSLRVLDGAVILVCGVGGIQTQTESVWRQADKHNIPRIIYINKLDRVGADYQKVIDDIENRFEIKPVVMNIPYYDNGILIGIIDIFNRELLTYDKAGKIVAKQPVPDDAQDNVNRILEKNLDNLTEIDDSLLESVLAGSYTHEQIESTVKYGVSTKKIAPIYCGASKTNVGISNLLDGIVTFLPSPNEANHDCDENAKTLAYVFKVQKISGFGKVAFARIYRGSLGSNCRLYNLRTGLPETITSVKAIFADMFDDINAADCGEIVGLTGPDDIITGDTLSDSLQTKSMESIRFSHPVMISRLEPASVEEYDKLNQAVNELAEEDAAIEVRQDAETGAIELSAMGELQIDIVVKRLQAEYKLNVKASPPSVAFKQKPTGSFDDSYTFDYRTADGAHQIKLSMTIEPNPDNNEDNIIEVLDDSLQYNTSKAIRTAINNSLNLGINNCGIISAKVTVTKTEILPNTLHLITETACSLCMNKLLQKTSFSQLQPIMLLTVEPPTEMTGLVLGDLQSKNAQILDISSNITSDVITAKVPLRELLGYSTRLRNQTQGRGSFSMELCGYSDCE